MLTTIKFWKTVKPLFGNKIKCKSQIALVEVNNLATDDKVLAKTFNKFFVNVAATLGIKFEKLPSNYHDINYNLDELIIRYNDHPSILAIKNTCTELNSTFTFKKVDKEQIFTAIKRLDPKKVSKSNDIPLRIIKEFSDVFGDFLAKNFNECFRQGFSTQHCLLVMVEKMKKTRDKKGVFAAVLADLSKAFDCIPHGLLIAKLNAFGFN